MHVQLGGGGPTTSVVAAGGTCSRTNTFTAAGFYTVTVTVDDGDGGSASDTVSLILFNPASIAKGKGKMNVPPGALVGNPQATGIANYTFNAKYPKNKVIPTGNVAFGFGMASFFFDATSYDWLVGIGDRAQLQGTGRVGGSTPHYGFLITVHDGTPDRFRIKIWDKNAGNAVVYDNVPGAPDDFNCWRIRRRSFRERSSFSRNADVAWGGETRPTQRISSQSGTSSSKTERSRVPSSTRATTAIAFRPGSRTTSATKRPWLSRRTGRRRAGPSPARR